MFDDKSERHRHEPLGEPEGPGRLAHLERAVRLIQSLSIKPYPPLKECLKGG